MDQTTMMACNVFSLINWLEKNLDEQWRYLPFIPRNWKQLLVARRTSKDAVRSGIPGIYVTGRAVCFPARAWDV